MKLTTPMIHRVVLCLILLPFPLNAAVLEEIIVTAQKREQKLQEVGISVTAFSGDLIDNLGYTNTTDISQQTPGLSIVQYSPGLTNVSIRGVSQNDFGDHLEPPIAVYVDEAYISVMGAASIQMYDIERVEVLRGPQGTLFGRNATGGLMHYISRKPTEEFEGYASITYAEYDQIQSEAAISGALGPNLQARLSLQTNHHDGWLENRIGEDLRDSATVAVRGQLLFQASENIEIWLKAHYSDEDTNGSAYSHFPSQYGPDFLGQFIGPNETGTFYDLFGLGLSFQTCPGCDGFGYKEPDDDPHTGAFAADTVYDREVAGGSGKITWNLENFTVTFITDYLTIDKAYLEDTDSTPFLNFHFSSGQDLEQISHEFRVNSETDRLRWQAGFYYLDAENDTYQTGEEDGAGFFGAIDAMGNPVIGDPFSYYQTSLNIDLDTESWAVFGHSEYDLSEQLTATVALRYTEDDKKATIRYVDNFGTDVDLDPSNAPETGNSWENFSVRAGLDWKPNENWLVYASFNRGHKGGSFTASAVGGPIPGGVQHDEEILHSYELGFKTTMLDGLARLNATAFYYDYKDYQASSFVFFSQIITNLDADAVGAEVELQATPTDGLDLSIGLSVMDSEVEDVGMPDGTIQDRKLVSAPDFSLNGLVRYEWPAFGGTMSVQGDFNLVGDHCFTVICHPTEEEDTYFVGNLRAGYTTGDGKWNATLFVNNVSDEEYRLFALDASFIGFGNGLYAKPRWFGGSISYNF